MGCIFRPEALSWEDIDGGRGEMTMEAIRNFISEYCYPDEYADYGDDEELPNELVFFAEMWERLDGYYTPISDSFQTAAVLSLKLTKSATKPDLVRIITHVASAYCWYVSLKARVEKAKGEE